MNSTDVHQSLGRAFIHSCGDAYIDDDEDGQDRKKDPQNKRHCFFNREREEFGQENASDDLHERGGVNVSGYVFTDSVQIICVHDFFGIGTDKTKQKQKNVVIVIYIISFFPVFFFKKNIEQNTQKK